MKYLRINTMWLLAFASLAVLSGCQDDEDSEDPKINQVLIDGDDMDEVSLEAGTSFTVTVDVSDDENLKQLKLNIHSAGDEHTHEGEEEEGGGSFGNWSENVITNLAGRSELLEYDFTVPDDILGFWHLEVQCIDDVGNEAEPMIRTLHIENPDFPQIEIDSTVPEANENGELEVSPGGFIDIFGTASDSDGLTSVRFELEDGAETEVDSWEYDPAGATSWELSQADINIPGEVDPGSHLHLHIIVTDTDGLVNMKEFEVHVE